MRVLITGGGTATAMSVLKGFRSQREIPVEIILADAQDSIAGRHFADGFERIPPASDPKFFDTLLEVCGRQRIELLIPLIDYEFRTFSEQATKFLAAGTRVAISSPPVIKVCGNKEELGKWLKSAGFQAPAVFQKDEILSKQIQFPLFVKPKTEGRGSLGAQRVDSIQELEVVCKKLNDPLIVEFIEGEEYTIDTISDFSGHFIAAMPRLRIETKAGVSVKGKTVHSPEMVSLAKKITEGLPILGASNIQCFRRRDSSLIVSEVNPRFSAALSLSIAAGLNSPLLLAQLAMGKAVRPETLALKHNVEMVRHWEEVFIFDDGRVDKNPWPSVR
jgi:carbamoyl-phosphate synthase large subunit